MKGNFLKIYVKTHTKVISLNHHLQCLCPLNVIMFLFFCFCDFLKINHWAVCVLLLARNSLVKATLY